MFTSLRRTDKLIILIPPSIEVTSVTYQYNPSKMIAVHYLIYLINYFKTFPDDISSHEEPELKSYLASMGPAAQIATNIRHTSTILIICKLKAKAI